MTFYVAKAASLFNVATIISTPTIFFCCIAVVKTFATSNLIKAFSTSTLVKLFSTCTLFLAFSAFTLLY